MSGAAGAPRRGPRLLLVAEAANPEWVSVPLVGWSLARAISAQTPAHIVTQIRNRDAFLRAGLVEGRDFTAIDSEALARPAWRLADRLGLGSGGGWTALAALAALSYPYFERLVWRRFGRRIRAGEWDAVLRLTPTTPTAIGPLAARCRAAGVPFILGPLNGGVPWPPGFAGLQRREREWLSHLRGLYRHLPGRRRMLEASSFILCGSRFALAEIPPDLRHKARLFPENGIDPARFAARADQPGTLPLRACFIGRLVPLKGLAMLLDAAGPLLADGRMRLEIIGDGSERGALEAQVAALGVGAAVTFHGWLAHREVQDVAARCHILTFPSIREFGGGAVLEAMALGVVPVVVDYAGPGELVDDEVGFKVPIGTPGAITRDLRRVLEAIAADPGGLAPRAAAARQRVETQFLWAAKARALISLADSVAKSRPPVP